MPPRPEGRRRAAHRSHVLPARTVPALAVLALAAGLLGPSPAAGAAGKPPAQGGVTFHDLAAREGSGITYRRTGSSIVAVEERLEKLPAINFSHVVLLPEKPRGAPGVALLDYDGDGDVDIYVTNGPGAANSLYSNQLVETGTVSFKDVAAAAGVEATSQDSTGVCFGDTDNDGDDDLLVLGRIEPNRFFENRGDGTFVEVARSGLGGGNLGHTSCSMGDVDNDGLLDVAIANSFDWTHREAIFTVAYAQSHPNQLFLNIGGNRFKDVSDSSGIRKIQSVQPAIKEGATLTWAIALVDLDQDGDLDLLHADDQAAFPTDKADRAHVHVFKNDGTGHFKDVTADIGTSTPGAWMGLAFGDFDCNGVLDIFATNFGDYGYDPIGFPFKRGQWSSRWFLGQPDGTYVDPGTGELRATPFGWSPMTVDYDNDGDTDVIYLGTLGTAVYTIVNDNPGAVLQNQGCTAHFRRDSKAMTTHHERRVVEGAASADLDGNGFPDVVSVSSHDIPPDMPQKHYDLDWGSPFDATAVYTEFLEPAPGGNFIPMDVSFPDGGLVIDMNGGGNGNGSVAVRTLGTVGLVRGGKVNRSGIGAVLHFTPDGMETSIKPVVGGASYASEDGLEKLFGLGLAKSGTVEVMWPGTVRNRLYDVARGEHVLLPEIPCSFDAPWSGEAEYRGCVQQALNDLVKAKVLRRTETRRYLDSALRAYRDARSGEAAAPPAHGGAERSSAPAAAGEAGAGAKSSAGGPNGAGG